MNLLQQLKNAARIYLDQAYSTSVPDRVSAQFEELSQLDPETDPRQWPVLEHENNIWAWRLGNPAYPHMKLVFKDLNGGTCFLVDAHDTHFTLPTHVPGSEKLIAVREANAAIKNRVEAAWSAAGLPVFCYLKPVVKKMNGQFQGARVLAIDDESKILDLLGIILQNLGCTFDRAESVSRARELIDAHPDHDLILCDIMMPVESGYDFVAWYHDRDQDTPIYYVTGLGEEHINRKGVVDVIQKPFSVKDIVNLLEHHCSQQL